MQVFGYECFMVILLSILWLVSLCEALDLLRNALSSSPLSNCQRNAGPERNDRLVTSATDRDAAR